MFFAEAKDVETTPYTHLGCWKDEGDRAIPQLDGSDPRITGSYTTRDDAINKCYEVAKEKGMVIFALQDNGWCAGDFNTDGYQKYGVSSACKDAKGGPMANDVYEITQGSRF